MVSPALRAISLTRAPANPWRANELTAESSSRPVISPGTARHRGAGPAVECWSAASIYNTLTEANIITADTADSAKPLQSVTLRPASGGCGSGSGINTAIGALSQLIDTLAAVTNDPDAGCVIAAADAVGAPLSELSRLLMHHEPTMAVTVPGWVADRVACAARLWGVCVPVAGAWLLAEGTSRLVQAAEADRLDLLTENIPGLNITDPDSRDDCRQLQVPTPGAELFVALGWLAKLANAHIRRVAAVGVAWGVARLHHTQDGHDCSTATSADIEPRPEPADGAALGACEAAVLAGVPLDQLALSLLAPTNFWDFAVVSIY